MYSEQCLPFNPLPDLFSPPLEGKGGQGGGRLIAETNNYGVILFLLLIFIDH